MRKYVPVFVAAVLCLAVPAFAELDPNDVPDFDITWETAIGSVVTLVGGIFALFLGLAIGWAVLKWGASSLKRIAGGRGI